MRFCAPKSLPRAALAGAFLAVVWLMPAQAEEKENPKEEKSLPPPPVCVSFPAPPESVSLAEPPVNVSFPSPPQMKKGLMSPKEGRVMFRCSLRVVR